MSQEPTIILPPLTIRPQKDFKALPDRERPGGSSADVQFFEEVSSGKLWVGKCSNNAMSLPQERVSYHAHYYLEYKEWLGLMLYRLLGIDVPQIALSEQLPVKPADSAPPDFDYEHPCLHVMSEFVEGFKTYGECFEGRFLENYRQNYTGKSHYALVEDKAPLQGFGATLAVACFLYDLDCLGRFGGNIGCVITTDKAGKPIAKTIKIDSGYAFSFLENIDGTYDHHDPRQRDVRFAPGKGDQTCIIRYDELSVADQAEFAQAARHILQVPGAQFQAVINQVVTPKGFTQQQADRLLEGLIARKSTFLKGYKPEVSAQLQAEVQGASKIVLASLGRKLTSLPESLPQLDSKHSHANQPNLPLDTKQGRFPLAASSLSSNSSSSVSSANWEPSNEADADGDVIETKQGRAPIGIAGKSSSTSTSSQLVLGGDEDDSKEEGANVKIWMPVRALNKSLSFSPSALPLFSTSKWASLSNNTYHAFNAAEESQAASLSPEQEKALLDELYAVESKSVKSHAELEKESIKGEKPDAKTGCQVFQKPAVTPYFTGREAILTTIVEQLHSSHSSVITQGISGLGGVGKTQIAARYAQLASEGATYGEQRLHYQAVVWLNAEHNLEVQFLMLAEAWCHKTGLKPVEAVTAVYRYLQDKRTLLVFDNAIDPTSIESFLPPSKRSLMERFKAGFASRHLHVLITSRNAQWQAVPTLTVSDFSAEEATAFVRQRLPTATAEQINTLLETVSTLPLALAHAVAYIAEGHSTLVDYPQQFALHQLSLCSATIQIDASHTVLTTFLLTLFKIKQQHPIVVPILQACAYLAPDGIPTAWLETALAGPKTADVGYKLGEYSLSAVQAGLAALQRHALLQLDKPGLLNVHRLVQQAVCYQLNPIEQQAQITRVLQWLTAANPEEDGNAAVEHAFLPHLETVINHYDRIYGVDSTEGMDLAIALQQLGRLCLYLSGQPAKSCGILERALRIQEAHYGRDHHEVATILNNLGNAYGELGQVDKQRELLERALRIQEVHYGRDHHEVAGILNNLSNAYGELGQVDKQRELLERALRIQEAHYGREHHELTTTMVNLGSVYGESGEMGKQRELLERALKIQEARYGQEHYVLAGTLINLGNAYGALGETSKECELLERALRIQEINYGPAYYGLADTLNNLGASYGNLGDVSKERELLERALVIKEAYYGPNHYMVAKTLNNLGTTYGELGDIEKQCELLERAVAIDEAHYGREHHAVADSLVNLGNAYGALGRINERCELLERALKLQVAHYGQEHYKVAFTLTNLGGAYGDLGEIAKQRELLERALAIFEAHYGRDNYVVAKTLNNLGTAYGELGDMDKQRELLERALAIEEAYYGREHWAVAVTLTNLGNAYGALGQLDKERELLERALALKEAHYGQEHCEVAITLANLGTTYVALGEGSKAYELLKRALAIFEVSYGPEHYQVAITLTNLGAVYGMLGKVGEKCELLERALRIKEAHYGQDHYQVAITLANLGASYGELGDLKKQRELLERALVIFEASYGPEHDQVASTLTNLGTTYGELGDRDKERELLERALKIWETSYGRIHPKLAIVLTNLAITYHHLKQSPAALETAKRAYRILTAHPQDGTEHPKLKQCLEMLQSTGGFTLAMLQSNTPILEEKKSAASSQTTVSSTSSSTAQLLSQHGLNSSVRQAQQKLGQAVLVMLGAINSQRQTGWEPQAHVRFTITTVVALTKGKEAFQQLCAQPELHLIPAKLGKFIQAYLVQHSELQELSNYPGFARDLKNDLTQGKLSELYTRFGIPKPEQKAVATNASKKKSACCLVM